MTNRTARILAQLDLPQDVLAAWLGRAQSTVSRMVAGQEEPGPVARLLDLVESVIARDGIEAAAAMVRSGGFSVPAASNDAGPAQQEDVA